MQNDQTPAQGRRTEHAKLLVFGDHQVLAFLQRDGEGELALVIQLWIAEHDEQLRIAIAVDTEDRDLRVQEVFDLLSNESLPAVLSDLDVITVIQAAERGEFKD